MGASFGSYPDNGYSYSVSSLSYGYGVKFPLLQGQFLSGINLGVKALSMSEKLFSHNISSSQVESMSCAEIGYRKSFLKSWIYTVGGKYYFKNIRVLETTTRFVLEMGIGLKL